MGNKFFYKFFYFILCSNPIMELFIFSFISRHFYNNFYLMLKKIYRIFAVPLFQDNYSYVIQGSKPNELVLVDPANPTVILEFLNKNFSNFQVSNILYTHKHWDHAGGNE